MPHHSTRSFHVSSRLLALGLLASLLLLLLLQFGLSPAGIARANHIPFQKGDVFAAGMNPGKIKHLSGTGTLLETLDDQIGAPNGQPEMAGMCVDAAGFLYATLITNYAGLSQFNTNGGLVNAQFGSGITYASESCLVDAAGNFYVGTNYGSYDIYKVSAAGNVLDNYNVGTDARGSDWIDLAADQCTMLYTSEGTRILRYNVCTKTQLTDFATGLLAPLYGMRLRPNGEVMVASATQIYRLSSAGAVLQTYPKTAYSETGGFFSLNLDPDGTSFWTGTLDTDNVYKIDIATGTKLLSFNVGPNSTFAGLAGLLIYGELRQARPTPTGAAATPTNTLPASTPTRLPAARPLFQPIQLNNPSGGATSVPSSTSTNAPINTATATNTPPAPNTATPTNTAPPATATLTPIPGCVFRDDFTGGLASGWSWTREDTTHYSFSTRPGYLRIITQSYPLGNAYAVKNLLLRTPPTDFDISTRVEFNPNQPGQTAALFAYQDDLNFVWVSRDVDPIGTNEVKMQSISGGSGVYNSIATTLTSVYLRIVKAGTTYTGYYSADALTWTQIYQFTNVNLTGIKVGLSGFNLGLGASEVPADFDYFCQK